MAGRPPEFEQLVKIADRIGYEQQQANLEKRVLSAFEVAQALRDGGFLAVPAADLSKIGVVWDTAGFALRCTVCGDLLDGEWSTLADIVDTARACVAGHEDPDHA